MQTKLIRNLKRSIILASPSKISPDPTEDAQRIYISMHFSKVKVICTRTLIYCQNKTTLH
jgi:hypothetical protein